MITFDEGSDSAACCGEASGFGPDHPNVPLPGKNGPGGGRIGAVLLSPLIRPGTVSTVDYNHYSLLRTVEDIFGLPHLGDAAMRRSDRSAQTYSASSPDHSGQAWQVLAGHDTHPRPQAQRTKIPDPSTPKTKPTTSAASSCSESLIL